MDWGRIARHLLTPAIAVRRRFPAATRARIEAAIAASERRHAGEIRFAVEAALTLGPLLRGETAPARAVEVFAELRVWETEHNNGVLIYLLLADRAIEIVADRGIGAKVSQPQWQAICQQIETELGQGRFEAGVLAGIAAVGELLEAHFPAVAGDRDELPNEPVVL